MTAPLIPYDLMFACAKALCAIVLVTWAFYEGYAWKHRRSRREILPPPRCDLIKRGGRDHWHLSDVRIIEN